MPIVKDRDRKTRIFEATVLAVAIIGLVIWATQTHGASQRLLIFFTAVVMEILARSLIRFARSAEIYEEPILFAKVVIAWIIAAVVLAGIAGSQMIDRGGFPFTWSLLIVYVLGQAWRTRHAMRGQADNDPEHTRGMTRSR